MKPINLAHEIANVDGKATLHFGEYSVPVYISTLAVNGPDRCIDIECKVTGEAKKQEKPATPKVTRPYVIDRVIFNDPATIVFWTDGTKTVVKCHKNDTYSEEVGLAMAICKKTFDDGNDFHKVFEGLIKAFGKKTEEKRDPKSEPVKSGRYPWGTKCDSKTESAKKSGPEKKLGIDTKTIYAQFCSKYPNTKHLVSGYARHCLYDNAIVVHLSGYGEVVYKYEFPVCNHKPEQTFTFKTLCDAYDAYHRLRDLVDTYGSATMVDMCDIANIEGCPYTYHYYGWAYLIDCPTIKQREDGLYELELPSPKPLT